MIIPAQWKDWKNNLICLLEEYKDINTKTMGFPDGWEKRLNSYKI